MRKLKPLPQAMLEYNNLRVDMKTKHTVGLITDDEYYAFMMKEDTLWNIIKGK